MLTDVFTVTLIVLFGSALLGAFIRSRARDRCLKDFAGFLVHVQESPAKEAWGRMLVHPNGIELVYRSDHHDREGHIETSIIYYNEALKGVRCLRRIHDELTPENQARRERELRRTYRPGFLRRTRRTLWNTANGIRDAILEALGLALSRAKSAGGSPVLAQDRYLSTVGRDLVGQVARAYDPILERYIGHRVVIEAPGPEGTVEYPGILKEYSELFLEVLEVRLPPGHEAKAMDLIFPRPAALLRHGGERMPEPRRKGTKGPVGEPSCKAPTT